MVSMPVRSAVLATLLLGATLAGCSGGGPGAIRIGVMLPLSGPDAADWQLPLDWARENVNAAGGVGGRRIDFVYRDVGRLRVDAVAHDFASDDSITAVIGPSDSEDARRLMSGFVDHKKVIVTPSATSADLFRAFSAHRPQYVWRTVESDIAQMRTMLGVAFAGGARSGALVASQSEYGNTFFDSFGFFATEAGLDVKLTTRYDQRTGPCEGPLAQALGSGADVVFAAPDDVEHAVCMARVWRAHGSKPRLLFSDSGRLPLLIRALGPEAEGIEGIGLAPDVHNGFATAFQDRFHRPPTPYAANAYDAVLLIACGLARSGAQAGAPLARALMAIGVGDGQKTSWDVPGITQTLRLLRAGGQVPYVQGAVGPWDFDKTSGLELVKSTYQHWRVRGSDFAVEEYRSTGDTDLAKSDESAARASPTQPRATANVAGTYQPASKTGTWALLVAASGGWQNYRHQADALAQYQRLRARGVPADRIVLVSDNDLATSPSNPRRGHVPYTVGGPNLNDDVHVDYPLRGMTADRLMAILSGLHSGPGDDLFIFFAGHGNQLGLFLGSGEPVSSPGDPHFVLTPAAFNQTLVSMAANRQYRRALIAVEACQGGVFGEALSAPGALLLSAANPTENSLSTNYDPKGRTWLADQFSFELANAERATPDVSLDGLYQDLYRSVVGSHVTAYGPSFGNAADVRLSDFLSPTALGPRPSHPAAAETQPGG